ncbi:hypothetical protein CTEN210_13980 [Chaetoceros tenuissimus]|uniref:tRNA pseudouridine synthase n=1 Tax=Chaetoceros tenuissimus TaxID=426638 RepID=A0AAD3D4C1_9STRA|nr:hypothetical protein CTEN210_13980 [Chaetoceros tenuissimus]
MSPNNSDTNPEESLLDRRLRELFAESDSELFHTTRSIMDTFMQNEQSFTPILRYKDGDVENLFTREEESYYDLFEPLYGERRKVPIELSDKEEVNSSRRGQSFKISLAYKGEMFCGWQIQLQNDVPSVQQTIIDCLDPILKNYEDVHSRRKKKMDKPIDVRVCGRTDAGVSAISQVCRARTTKSVEDVCPSDIQQAINSSNKGRSGSITCTEVVRVSDKFHPTFGATHRAYVFCLDSSPLVSLAKSFGCNATIKEISLIMDVMLQSIEGKELDFFSLSFGKVKTETTLCELPIARAVLVETNDCEAAIAIHLVGDRFLRRMVRILVATVLRETISIMRDEEDIDICLHHAKERLISIINSHDRIQSAKAASSNGLIFVGARFND